MAVRGSVSNIVPFFLLTKNSNNGAGKTALTNASSGLTISVRRELAPSATTYSGANILSITTLGTWAAPGSGKVRFKEIDATNQPGMYEIQFEDSLFDTSDASRYISGMIQQSNIVNTPFVIPLTANDQQTAITVTGGKVTPIDVDGITYASAMEVLLAVIAGVATVSGNDITFKKRDGTTSKITVTVGSSPGQRTASSIP